MIKYWKINKIQNIFGKAKNWHVNHIIWIFQKHPSIDELKSLWIASVASGSTPSYRKHSVSACRNMTKDHCRTVKENDRELGSDTEYTDIFQYEELGYNKNVRKWIHTTLKVIKYTVIIEMRWRSHFKEN